MKKLLFLLSFFLAAKTELFAQHSLEKIWQTDSTLKTPESVLFVEKSKFLYVSNIGDTQTPNTGFISKVGLDGKIITRDWVTGLNATKGLGLYKNNLYAAELNAVAVIDVNKSSITQRINIEGSGMLNDITVDSKGVVYVSDSRTGKVHRIENGKASVYLEDLKGINGLLSVGAELYILADGKFLKAGADKKLTTITTGLEGGADGIVQINAHEFVLSCWAGVIYYVKDDGSKQILLDTREQKSNTADLGYDPKTKTVYVPTFGKNSVVAYKLK